MINEPYVGIEELAKHFSVSVSTVRKWLKKDMIPALKLDGVFRFKRSEVEEALRKFVAENGDVKEDGTQADISFDPNEDF
jgi:excisionase family DNA binding protein